MFTPRRRSRSTRPARTPAPSAFRSWTAPLALAAAVALMAAPAAAAQSEARVEVGGTIAVSSLGSTAEATGSVGGSLGAGSSLGSLAPSPYAEYVALGDSYAAFGDQEQRTADASDPAAECARSLTNYPNQLDAHPLVGELTDATCGGAVTGDILDEAQHEGVPPQLEALDADTDLVTLSIGGNDVGFAGIVACMAGSQPGDPNDCEGQLGDTVRAAIDEVFGEGGPVDQIYDEIAEASPDATVVATQYLPLMPANDEGGCGFTTLIGQANLEWARAITADINAAVDEAARRNGHVSVLPTSDIDRSGCAPADERWTDFIGGTPTNAAPMHPTTLGQEAMAAAVAEQLAPVGVLS